MKKKITRTVFIILLMLPLAAFSHFLFFPQETRCILIRFADFDKKENIYFRKNCPAKKINELLVKRSIAEKRVNEFWDKNSVLDYDFVYCNTEKDFNDYGHLGAPAVTQLKMGAWIVLQEESLDVDIIAHEISHTVLYNNIGWYKTRFMIPAWFNEGLAMQVDERDYYSIDSLMEKKRSGVQLPDVTKMKSMGAFLSGSHEQVMLNFSTARFVVHEWLKAYSLQKFEEAIRNGNSFEQAYTGIAEEK